MKIILLRHTERDPIDEYDNEGNKNINVRITQNGIKLALKTAQDLKDKNEKLVQENGQLMLQNSQLAVRLNEVEETLIKGTAKSFEERELTTTVVDKLIASIDLLVNNESCSNDR